MLIVADLNLESGAAAADSALKIVSLLSAGVAGLLAAARYLLPGSRRSAQGLVETSDNPMREVGRLFARARRRAAKPVVFLIDDLDRCDADYVVEFLEVMQTVVRQADAPAPRRRTVAGPYAFIAADGQWIRTSYQRHYDSFAHAGTPGRPLGYLFLEKIFQLHVRLPSITPTARDAFLAALLTPDGRGPSDADQVELAGVKAAVRGAESQAEVIAAARRAAGINNPAVRMDALSAAAVKFSEPAIHDATEHELRPYGAYLELNPRSVKLFVNTYGVLRSLRTLEENFVDPDPLALWTVIETRWPYLADYLRRHPEAIEHRDDPQLSEDIRDLLRDGEVSTVFDQPRWGGKLTADLIRRCAGSL